MTPYITLLLLTLSAIEAQSNSTCDGFEAIFDMKSVIGPWYVVALIPEKLYPDKPVTCYKVEFSETDEAGLRWLVNKTIDTHDRNLTDITGTIIRQRYHAQHPFDVWSKSVGGHGCFQQVMSLDANKSVITKALAQEAKMQLHILEPEDKSEPFLVQILWGRMISAVIYRQQKGVTQDQLKPVYELMTKLRGPQRLPKLCEKYQKETLVFD